MQGRCRDRLPGSQGLRRRRRNGQHGHAQWPPSDPLREMPLANEPQVKCLSYSGEHGHTAVGWSVGRGRQARALRHAEPFMRSCAYAASIMYPAVYAAVTALRALHKQHTCQGLKVPQAQVLSLCRACALGLPAQACMQDMGPGRGWRAWRPFVCTVCSYAPNSRTMSAAGW